MNIDNDISTKMLDYLAHVYRLADQEKQPSAFVSTSALADQLDVSAPAVNRMINKLKESGYLQHEPYQGIRLTESGRLEALKYLRRHRIAEVFLVKVMGFSWDDIHDEAENLSSAMSETITARMNEMAENPAFCPHGEPIPSADGTVKHLDDDLLSNFEDNSKAKVTRILTRETDRLQYIQALGLMPGAELEVLHVAPFNGPLQLKLGDEYRIIGNNLAALIRAKRV